MFLDAPRGFRGPQLIADRIAMLDTADRNQPLRAWADDLSLRRGAVVPQFDPTDAGVDARVLLLLEAPGPMANSGNRRPGSGFISADNNDQTAETAWRARDAAGLHEGVLAWNVTPRYLGAVKPLLQRHRVNTEVFRDLLDRHSGIALVSPGELHDGTWMQAWERRDAALQRYFAAHAERFNSRPTTPTPAETVGINLPEQKKPQKHAA